MSTDALLLATVMVAIILPCMIFGLRRNRFYIYAWYIGFPLPKYQVAIEKNLMIPMKDGVKLATDVYRPKSPGKYPVIISRTPYNKNGNIHPYRQLAELFSSQGYVFIIQDIRGKHGSEGEFEPFIHESLDGFNTIEWAGEAEWSNGHVALYGFSYLGSCAWMAVNNKSRYLKTIIPMFTTQDSYSIWIDQGVPYLKGPLYWFARFHAKKDLQITNKKIGEIIHQLPVFELDVMTADHKIHPYRDYLSHLIPDHFWQKRSVQNLDEIDVPVFIVGGWYDPFLQGGIEDFQLLSDGPAGSKNRKSYLMIGPWPHNPTEKFKDVNYGTKANFNNHLVSTLKWCDIWLKEKEPLHPKTGRVDYFIMGKNEWRESTHWPPPNIKYEKYYLTKKGCKGKAETAQDGPFGLSKTPSEHVAKTNYVYDPINPVPFRGSYLLHRDSWIGPVEQTEITRRNDVLTYMTDPLDEELIIAGPVKLVIFVSSTAVDTDFSAKICDVRSNGKSYNLQAGVMRMRYRDSLTKQKIMVPGNIYRIEISLRSVANAFLKNHRIQLQVASTDFPVHDRNLNTGMSCEFSTETKIAHQTVYYGGLYKSYLLLPVLAD